MTLSSKVCLRCETSIKSETYCPKCIEDFLEDYFGGGRNPSALGKSPKQIADEHRNPKTKSNRFGRAYKKLLHERARKMTSEIQKYGEVRALEILRQQCVEPSLDFFQGSGFEYADDPCRAPKKAGVYVIFVSESERFSFSDASCIYVGQSSHSMRKRLLEHCWVYQVLLDFRSVAFFCKDVNQGSLDHQEFKRELQLLESLFIGLLRPSFNFTQPYKMFGRTKADSGVSKTSDLETPILENPFKDYVKAKA